MVLECHGNGKEHCCWVKGKICPYLEENTVPGRHWVCGLRRELPSWDAVHKDPRYIALGFGDILCGDWPEKYPVTDEYRCCFETRPEVLTRIKNA